MFQRFDSVSLLRQNACSVGPTIRAGFFLQKYTGAVLNRLNKAGFLPEDRDRIQPLKHCLKLKLV
jgi:hypothetical protein